MLDHRDNFLQEYVTQHLYPIISEGHSILYHPYFFKRKVFEYENEARVIIDIDSINGNTSQDIDSNGKYCKVKIDDLVEKVIISPYAEDWIVDTVRCVVKQYNFNLNVKKSELLVDPTS